MKRNAPWWTSKCATSAGPAHLSTPPRLGLGSAARARSERTAARAGAGCFSDHAVSAAPAVVPAAVLRKRRRFTLPRRGWSMSRTLLWAGTRLPYARGQRSSTEIRRDTPDAPLDAGGEGLQPRADADEHGGGRRSSGYFLSRSAQAFSAAVDGVDPVGRCVHDRAHGARLGGVRPAPPLEHRRPRGVRLLPARAHHHPACRRLGRPLRPADDVAHHERDRPALDPRACLVRMDGRPERLAARRALLHPWRVPLVEHAGGAGDAREPRPGARPAQRRLPAPGEPERRTAAGAATGRAVAPRWRWRRRLPRRGRALRPGRLGDLGAG